MAKLDYNGDVYGLKLEHLKVGEDFNPELGFLRREDFRRHFAQARFSPRPRSLESIRRFAFQGELDYITDLERRLETRRLQGQFQIELENSDEATIEYTRNFEFLPEAFEISDGVVLPVAEYRFQDVNVIYRFGAQRPVPGSVSFRTGSFFGGDREELSYRGRLEISSRFSIEPGLSLNFVELPQGDFTARLVSSRFNWMLSPRTLVSSLMQYNSGSDSLSSSVRLNWEYEPGSNIFVVYTDGRETNVTGFPRLLNRTLAFKMTKLFRF